MVNANTQQTDFTEVNPNSQKIATVIGAGAWGSTLADVAERSDHHVRLWSRHGEATLESVIQDAEILLSAVSMKGVNSIIDRVKTIGLPESAIIVTATKGLDSETTHTPSQLWQEAFPNHRIVVLSGPNLAKEIQQNLPAATVMASENQEAAEAVQEMFACETFRVYINNDPIGTELGGTLKNVIAIAAGVCDGLSLGTNAKAGLLTRALPEMIRVGTTLGASTETFFGLSGLGDLLATCDSPLSRNYQVGYRLAQGETLEEIVDSLEGTAEGINTTQVLVKLARHEQIPIPISAQVYRLLKGKSTPQQAVQALMARELKSEFDDLFED
ncbi:MAG: NAD(P)H-dependent glycerol-3-phosphate dehydrogenase [Cyanobacteria bacterium SW_9_44_58]|nr:MAG: NAD(P)H-dependent glycerol-3-phosphate dehydrogenase [Cyanobacteria bacterium SW_9_44_58]